MLDSNRLTSTTLGTFLSIFILLLVPRKWHGCLPWKYSFTLSAQKGFLRRTWGIFRL